MKLWKENRGFIMITGLVALIPMAAGVLLWQKLPDTMVTHFGSGNVPNGWSSREFVVFGLPLFCLAGHLLCAFFTASDPRKQGISGKMYRLLLLICPGASLVCGVSIYGYVLSLDVNMEMYAKLFVGASFLLVGNYLPKIHQNYTVGLKFPWTLDSEENWNRTHRLAGWIWMFGGTLFMINAFTGTGRGGWVPGILAVMVIVPAGYSLVLYIRKHGGNKK